jgi:ATP-dependent DNA ligase
MAGLSTIHFPASHSLCSRNNEGFDAKYPAIVEASSRLRDETGIDGEVIALDHPAISPATEVTPKKFSLRTRYRIPNS